MQISAAETRNRNKTISTKLVDFWRHTARDNCQRTGVLSGRKLTDDPSQ